MKTNRIISLLLVICLAFSLFTVNVSAASPLTGDSHLWLGGTAGNFVFGIPLNSTGAQLKMNFAGTATGIADDAIVKSGDIVKSVGADFTAIVVGDVSGDAKVTSADYLLVKKSFAGAALLNDWMKAAADISSDEKITSVDYLRIKQYFAGKYDLYEGMKIEPGYGISVVTDSTGGTARIEDGKIVVYPESGMRLSSLKGGDKEIYVTDNQVAIEDINMFDTEVVAKFEPMTSEGDAKPESVTITFYDETAMVYGINWRTEGKISPAVKYIKDPGHVPSVSEFASAKTVTGYTRLMAGFYKNTAALYGLEAGVKYYYIVTDLVSETNSEVNSFTVADAKTTKPFTFFHMSDTQDESHNGTWWNVALENAYKSYPNAVFTVNTGDIVQYGGNEALWTQMFANTKTYTASNVLVGVAGNHDYWAALSLGNAGTLYSHFNVAVPDGQDGQYGIYYSYDFGDAHFIVLDTGDTMKTGDGINAGQLTDKQMQWLENDLKTTKKTWKIVMLHNPLYSPGKYGSQTGKNNIAINLRTQLNPVFDKYNVDLVLNGHDHVYSQSYPITGTGDKIKPYEYEEIDGIKYIKKNQGTVHLESACGGEQRRSTLAEGRLYSEKMAMLDPDCVGYSAITVDADKITVAFTQVNTTDGSSKVSYTWGITK